MDKNRPTTLNEPTAVGQALLGLGEHQLEMRLLEGTEQERAMDISLLRKETHVITLDEGFRNTGACRSAITFIDGERGILRYRGYPIEQLAEYMTFPEVALMLIQGEAPTLAERSEFSRLLTRHELLHEGMRHLFEGFPPEAPPMAILSAMINAIACYHDDLLHIESEEAILEAAAKLLSKVRTIAAFSYKKSRGEPFIYPDPQRDYCSNFLHMMHTLPYADYEPSKEAVDALRVFLILHADHEQNCSTATARIVGSSGANLFASVAAAVCALWGPLHGGANSKVMLQLESIERGEETVRSLVDKVKEKKALLWGFGHRVYKNFDPRVKVLSRSATRCWRRRAPAIRSSTSPGELEEIATPRRLLPHAQALSERGLLLGDPAAHPRHPCQHVPCHVRHRSHARLDRQLGGAVALRHAALSSPPDLRGTQGPRLRAHRPSVGASGGYSQPARFPITQAT